MIPVIPINFEAFAFIIDISPLQEVRRCVLHYNIVPTSSDGSLSTNISLMATGGEQVLYSINTGFNLTHNTYNFTVVAITMVGPGKRSPVTFPSLGLNLSEFHATHSLVFEINELKLITLITCKCMNQTSCHVAENKH